MERALYGASTDAFPLPLFVSHRVGTRSCQPRGRRPASPGESCLEHLQGRRSQSEPNQEGGLLIGRLAIVSRHLEPGSKITVRDGTLRATDSAGKHHVVTRTADGKGIEYRVNGDVMMRDFLPRP